ncbi:MAG: hypothetical protein ACOCG6_07160 [Candidatus Cloacimonadaceae bacterium]
MSKLTTIESKDLVNFAPTDLAIGIRELAEDISKNKSDLEKIQNRSAFQRMFSNNTKDLAKSMIAQGDTIAGFMEVVKGIVFCQIGNLSTLMKLREMLIMQKNDVDDAGKDYLNLAINYLDEALNVSKIYDDKFTSVNDSLKKLEDDLTEKTKIEKEHKTTLLAIQKDLARHDKIESEHTDKLMKLEDDLNEKTENDKEQNKKIKDLQDNLAKADKTIATEKDKLIKLEVKADNTINELTSCNDKLNNLHIQHDETSIETKKALKSSTVCLILLTILTLINTIGLIALFYPL